MTIEQPAFGKRVRERRRVQGLSQGDLAGEGVSSSYVSLVESGHRIPSLKAAKVIAGRLGVTLEELSEPEAQDKQRTHRLQLVGLLVAARSSQLAGDWSAARSQLETVVRQAGDGGFDEVRWEARWELATVLDRLGADAEREATLLELLHDPITAAAPLMRTRAAIELADLYRRTGRLSESVTFAEDAAGAADTLDAARPERVQAQVVLLTAYVESGEWHRAKSLGDALLQEVPSVPAEQQRACALWAAAGARHLGGGSEALGLLAEADALLGPADDVRLRIRLGRARALLAVSTGDDSAPALLDRVRLAGALDSAPAAAAWLAALEALAAVAAVRSEEAPAATAAAAADALDPAALPPLDRARCTVVRARARRAAEQEAAAAEDFKAAASEYEKAGAVRLAMETWRELSTPGHVTGIDPHAVLMP
ncbi:MULTISPECIES: helix-turn-helix transcriptional regulator [unclassified Streptomyces]|uniref:helix-turn-helix domain-containing protein n=1 Tax=unclassified Streptomyces TaxID=2593676 RepID=UPI00099778F8|nr:MULTISPECIES: helix-turn-helix transcriptional regulator [unclassified Streptomyces]ARE74912.1 transcriptional regulator [Streptomyces sp. Sge12]